MKLVDNWKSVYKWYSTWAAAASVAMQGIAVAYVALPPEWRAVVPQGFVGVCAVGGLILAGLIPFFRVLQQGDSKHPE